MISIKIFSSITEIDPGLWDNLNIDNDYFKSHEFISIIESSDIENSVFWYLLFYSGNEIIGAAVLCSFIISLDLFIDEKTKKAIKLIRTLFPRFLMIRCLFCGLPVSIGKDAVLIKNMHYKEEFFMELVKTSKIIARENKAKIINFKEFYSENSYGLSSDDLEGFISSWSIPYMVFKIEWKSYADYLQDMRYTYRRQVRQNLARADFMAVGYRNVRLDVDHAFIELMKPAELDPDMLFSQYMNVMSRAEAVLETLNRNFFANFLNRSSCSKVIVLKKEELILGHAIIIEEGQKLTFMLVGILEDYRKKYDTYFNLVNAVIAYGINGNFKEIFLGQTSYYVKSRIGGKIKPMIIFNYSPDKWIHLILKILNRIIFPELKPVTHHVFKGMQ
jgi:predicted N-acyltransferase